MWPGFKCRRRRHMWVEFVVGSLPCSERFFSGYSGFPLSSKTNISKFQFDQESGRRRTTMWMCFLQIVIYLLFIYLSFAPVNLKVVWPVTLLKLCKLRKEETIKKGALGLAGLDYTYKLELFLISSQVWVLRSYFLLPIVVIYDFWNDHVIDWWKHKDDPNVLFLKYEDLHKVVLKIL